MADLFAESDSEEEVSLKTENEYAKNYDKWREKEELHKLEQKYGPDGANVDLESSDSEDSSDDTLEVSETVEEDFLKTLSMLKKKDPRIYDPKYKFFRDKNEDSNNEVIKNEKKPKAKKEVTSLAMAFEASDDSDDGEEIFKVEKASELADKQSGEALALQQYLRGEREQLGRGCERDLDALRALWADPAISEGDAFLRDYILNKRYLGGEGDAEAGAGAEEGKLRDDAPLEADRALVEEQATFERHYNFRFEEPDPEYLKRYPRTMNFIRPKDDRRARKRAEVKARKLQERQKHREEVARLKALKLREIRDKMDKIREVTGLQDLPLQEGDVEGEWSAEEHDRRMAALFDERYYADAGADAHKPTFPDLDDELEIENWEEYEPRREGAGAAGGTGDSGAAHCEDENFNMDAEYDASRSRALLLEEVRGNLEGGRGGGGRRGRKRRSCLAQLLEAPRPPYVPGAGGAAGSYAAHMEQYYALECEDVIAGELRTRFKYRDCLPNSYGLTLDEILLADDKELNAWVSLKKAMRRQAPSEEAAARDKYTRRAQDEALKRRLLPSLYRALPQQPEIIVSPANEAKNKNNKIEDSSSKTNSAASSKAKKKGSSEDDRKEASAEGIKEGSSEDKRQGSSKNKTKDVDAELRTQTQHDNETVITTISNNKNKNRKRKHSINEFTVEDISSEEKCLMKSQVAVPTKRKRKKHKSDAFSHSSNQTSFVVSNSGSNQDVMPTTDSKVSTAKTENQNERVDSYSNENDKESTQHVENGHISAKKRKKKKNKNKSLDNTLDNQKRKSNESKELNSREQTNKNLGKVNKNKNKMKNKKPLNKAGASTDPLQSLSDERLKAYGLNPKKYRSFLKYKKF